MKRMFYLVLAALAIVTACQKEISENAPSVSFASAIPVTVDGTATLTLAVENYTGTEAVTVPVEFGGEAVLGEDYEVSAEAFVIGGASPVTTITVTPLVYGTDKSVTATILPPDGFVAGRYASTAFSLSDQLGRFSFTSNTAAMTSSVTISARIYDDNDNVLRLQNGDEIEVSVNTEKSTAVEGVNFEFADGKKAVVFSPEEQMGYITLNIVGEVNDEANTIVLDFVTSNSKYGAGQYTEVTITIIGPLWNDLNGTWKINELLTTKETMTETWYIEDPAQLNGFPEFNEDDMFTVDIASEKFIPSFQSDFKNFFIGESKIAAAGEYSLRVGMYGETAELQLFDLNNVNRDFSAATAGEPGESAYVGMRFITEEETGEQLLDLYLIDYHSTDFLTIFEEYYCYNEERPVLTMSGCYIQATFKKVE